MRANRSWSGEEILSKTYENGAVNVTRTWNEIVPKIPGSQEQVLEL